MSIFASKPFTITVNGAGSEKVLADAAIIVFSFESRDKDEQKATQDVADLIEKVKGLKKDKWDKAAALDGRSAWI